MNIPDFLNKQLGHFGHVVITPMSLVGFVVMLLVAFVVTKVVTSGTARVMKKRGVAPGVRLAVSRLVRYVVGFIMLMVALGSAGIDLGAVLAASTVVMVGIGLGLQRTAQDFLAGLVLLFERPVQKGDFIRVRDMSGTVEFIGARTTRVVTRDKVTLIVPNSDLTSSVVTNLSHPPEALRVWIRVGVAYGSDPEHVKQVMLSAAATCSYVLSEPASNVYFEDFGDSSLRFALMVFIADPRDDLRAGSEVRFALAKALAAAGITVPYPQLDVHVHPSSGSG